MAQTISIKKGNMEIVKTDRSNLIEVQQSYDGMVFTFKNGFLLTYTDSYMPSSSKDLIVNSANSFSTANLVIDLINYTKPISANIS
jgi:hypothetical protein